MEFRLLGEVELLAAQQLLDVGTPRQQTVLAALIVDAGRPVPIETLIDRIWPDGPPAEARNVLYSHLSRIRQLLRHAADLAGEPPVVVERRHAGYVVGLDPDQVDLHRFRRLVETGRDPRRAAADRSAALTEALALWRDRPLAGLTGEWVENVRDVWSRLRLDAVLGWAPIEIELGRPGTVIGTLAKLVAEHPYVEPLEELLMLALHASGRDAEALDRYAAIRERLSNDLGTDPGPELQSLHQAILRGDLPAGSSRSEITARTDHPERPARADRPERQVATPAQLPPATYGFTGRDSELHHLDDLLAAGRQSTAVVISAVSGTAGVGKTTLALHWAHRVRDCFPDGQLYANLRGFDARGTPVSPAEVARSFLDAFGVPPDRIPAGFDAQIGLYRSLLAERRVLVVLDNASDCEQVRPLLPGVPGCLTIVTSRNQLGGLTATTGAQPLVLDLLTVAESRDLLAGRLGRARVAAESQAVDDIIDSCARLPLALAIVASRAAAHPGFPLAALAEELRAVRSRLDELAGADPATDARAVFSWSYRQLQPDTARLFRLLGLHPGPDVSAPAAASLVGLPAARARRQLAELAAAHLLNEHRPGRYTFHDLLRAYAAEQAQDHESAEERQAALRRLFDYYVHTAHRAALLLNPVRHSLALTPAAPAVSPEDLTTYGQAAAWLEAEHTVVLACIDQASAAGFPLCAWQLAWAVPEFLDRHGLWHSYAVTQRTAVAAAEELADPPKQAFAHRQLGRAYLRLGDIDGARSHLMRALDLSRELADHAGVAHTQRFLGQVSERTGDHAKALRHLEQALELYRIAGDRLYIAYALNDLGWNYAALGQYEPALSHCQLALELQLELEDQDGSAHAWDSLGYIHYRLGQFSDAVACFQHACDQYGGLGNRYEQARSFTWLGESQRAAGDMPAALKTWQRAADIFSALGNPVTDDTSAPSYATWSASLLRKAHV